ncbi:energy transducer TonB [Candidatus Methylopumilus universalis]|uniref:energy transducer TonB n=1 Tax=Candidatus Methylopumilus universalis TaxID=2588536 RepID=UPI00111FCB75|nr:energy transducer TonB [Candidatus Methylopumilus universalis]QDC50501.1 energy transducer TonB [Candidatus Methylopumilus universalis]
MKSPAFFYREFDLPRAIILSILFHLLVVFLLLPKMNKQDMKVPPPLQVSLAQAKSMENKPTPEKEKPLEPPKPEVKKPAPPKPEVKKEPLPAPDKTPTTVPLSKPPVSVTPKEEQVIETNPKPEANPTRVITKAADTPQETKTVNAPSPEKVTSATNDYSSLLAAAIAKYKQYPKIAQMRGWQGLIIIELQLNPQGGVIYSQIKKSSGYDVLDQEALEMIKRASPFPQPPEALRNKNFTVLVPISFKLE